MSEQQTTAASSPADVDVFNGIEPTHAEFSKWRETGEVAERFKPAVTEADAATADAPEETVEEAESEPESDPEEAQEPPQKSSPAQKRILQLLAEKKELQRKLEAAAKPDAHSDSSTAQAQQSQTRTKPTVEAVDKDGKPKYATYEDYVEDLADWKAEQQVVRFQQAQQQQEELKAIKAQFEEAKSRYADADTVIIPTAQAIHDAQIPAFLKQVFAESQHLPDLCYVLGSDPATLEAWISLGSANPRAALAQLFEFERHTADELAKGKDGSEQTSGTAPEKKQTAAPKPPSPVGGTSSRTFDVSDESLSADEWARKRNKQLGKV